MGRPRTFDREVVLDRAMDLFWERGYEATSVQALVDAMGINRASLYDCFGDKHGLFRAALERYLETVSRKRLKILEADGPARGRLVAYFDDMIAFAEGPGSKLGCLTTNALVELAPRDGGIGTCLHGALDGLQGLFETVIEEGRRSGEFAVSVDAAAAARFLVAIVQGMRVVSRGGFYGGRELQDIVTTALSALEAPPVEILE